MKKIVLFSLLLLSTLFVNAQFTESKKPDVNVLYRGLSYGWFIQTYTTYNPSSTSYVYFFGYPDGKYQDISLIFNNFQEFKDFVVALNRCIEDKELQLSNKETSTRYKYTLYQFSNMGTKNVKILLYTSSGIKEGWIQKVDILKLNNIVGI